MGRLLPKPYEIKLFPLVGMKQKSG
jgi:hypothetical protein